MSNYRPPWSASASGTFTSDRLKPKSAKQQGGSGGKDKKGKDGTRKSPRVRELEGILKRLRVEDGQTRDPDGGCFCLARSHALSPYVPICSSCGLILCELNPPSSCCPFASCGAPLVAPTARSSLITRVETEIQDTIQHEFEEEQRKRDELKAQEGSFPLLGTSSASSASAQSQKQQPQTYKVLSLNSKTKKATIASYSPRSSTPVTPSPASSVEALPQGPPRIPPPAPVQVAPQPDPLRPFMDLRKDMAIRATYVRDFRSQAKRIDSAGASHSEASTRGRGLGGRVVPGAS